MFIRRLINVGDIWISDYVKNYGKGIGVYNGESISFDNDTYEFNILDWPSLLYWSSVCRNINPYDFNKKSAMKNLIRFDTCYIIHFIHNNQEYYMLFSIDFGLIKIKKYIQFKSWYRCIN
jgi:hypothetical protein